MTFDTAMWIFLVLFIVGLVGSLAHQERQYRRQVRDCRRRWQDEIDRRTR